MSEPLTREEREWMAREMFVYLPSGAPPAAFTRLLADLNAVESERDRLREILRGVLNEWGRMPDAGLTSDDPRFDWWNETAGVRAHARNALTAPEARVKDET